MGMSNVTYLSPKRVAEVSKRLHTAGRQRANGAKVPAPPPAKLTKLEQQEQVHRMYYAGIDRMEAAVRRERAALEEQRTYQSMGSPRLSREEQNNVAFRLCDHEVYNREVKAKRRIEWHLKSLGRDYPERSPSQ
eukprot:Sspe_Gene.87086::Locus_57995_Transcript_1_1_Confidence_1.000_Length_400::g.87086::m.87086